MSSSFFHVVMSIGISDFSKNFCWISIILDIGCSFFADDTRLGIHNWDKVNLQINRRSRSSIDQYIHDPRVSRAMVTYVGISKSWATRDRKMTFIQKFLFLLGGGGQFDPQCSFFYKNSKSIGLRLLKFSDFSYIPKALPVGPKPAFNTNCLSPQAHCLNDCFFL